MADVKKLSANFSRPPDILFCRCSGAVFPNQLKSFGYMYSSLDIEARGVASVNFVRL